MQTTEDQVLCQEPDQDQTRDYTQYQVQASSTLKKPTSTSFWRNVFGLLDKVNLKDSLANYFIFNAPKLGNIINYQRYHLT